MSRMTYEYEGDISNSISKNKDYFFTTTAKDMKDELKEVYRKAKAFDEIKEFVTKKLKEEEEKSIILLDDYDYGLNQAYNNVDDIIQEHMEDE